MTPTTRRTAAILAALSFALLLVVPAHAVSREAATGTLAWGFKESFRNYVARQIGAIPPIGPAPEGERVTVHDGARFDPAGTPTNPGAASDPNESLPYLFEVVGGRVTSEDELVVRTRGAVTFSFPSHRFTLTVSGLSVVVTEGSARLVGDVVQVATEDFGQFTKGTFRVEQATIATVGEVDVVIDGDTATVTGTGLAVHEDAAEALPQDPRESLDPFTLTVGLGGEITEPDPEPEPEPTPEPTPEPGELSWRVAGPGTVDLGIASVEAESFLATATLPEVVVTDTRAGGPAWRVTGQASDFEGEAGVVRARHLGWAPTLLEPGGGAVAGEVVAPRLAGGTGLAKARTLAVAPHGHPAGSATLGGTLELRAPLGAGPGRYRAVLTITAVG